MLYLLKFFKKNEQYRGFGKHFKQHNTAKK